MRLISLLAALAMIVMACSSVSGSLSGPVNKDDGLAMVSTGPLSSALSAELVQRGFRLVDRSTLAASVDEMALGQTGLTRETAVKPGMIATFRYFISVQATYVSNRPDALANATVQLIEANSGTVVGAITWSSGGTGGSGGMMGPGMGLGALSRKSAKAAASDIADKLAALVSGSSRKSS